MRFNGLLAVSLVGMAALQACGGTAAPAQAPSSAVPAAASKPAASVSTPRQPAASAAASGLIPIKSAYTNIVPASGPQWVAKERGFFAQNGLDVTIASLPSTAHIPALMAGDMQFVSVGPTEIAAADLQGGSVLAVASSSDLPTFSLYADKKYNSVPDLAGQTVGVTAIGSSSDAVAHLFLSHFGVEDKVKITAAGGTSTAILAALSQGVIGGAILAQPTGSAAAANFRELVNGVKLGVPFALGHVVVTRAYAKDHPDIITRYLRAYVQAWKYVADPANKADMIAIFEKYTHANAQLSQDAYESMLPVWQAKKSPRVEIEPFANALKNGSDAKLHGVDPKQFFDDSFIDAILPPS